MGPKILVVDDDRAIVQVLQTELERAGYQVQAAFDGEAAVAQAEKFRPALIIMDVMMPKCGGLAATLRIRQESNVPILMLSAKAEGTDRVLGLEAGADDYLVKPFFQQELLARVKALLRRYQLLGSARDGAARDCLRVGELVLEKEKKRLTLRGEPVHLTATEFRILELMMASPGRVFSAEEIYERVWEADAYAVENTVMVHISRIREKIELDPRRPEYLKVIWGIGYVLEAP